MDVMGSLLEPPVWQTFRLADLGSFRRASSHVPRRQLLSLARLFHRAQSLAVVGPGGLCRSPLAAWCVDGTYTNGGLKVFFEGLQSYGTLSPSRYVSYGPSNRLTDLLVGVNWTSGPITYRFCYSVGFDDDPSGTQNLFVPGITVAVTKNVEFYLEYAFQDVRHSGNDKFTTLENGIQAVLHWHF
jgi:hypothetical protein